MDQLSLESTTARHTRGVERARLDGGLHRAAGLVLVTAVAEAAALGKLVDIRERPADTAFGLPQLDLAQARRVDHHAATRKADQLARHRGVPADAVAADLARRQAVGTKQSVDERRLSHTRRSDERDGLAGAEVCVQLLEPVPSDGTCD